MLFADLAHMRNISKKKIARVRDRKYSLNFKTEAKHLIQSRAVLIANFNVLSKPDFRHPTSRAWSSNITSQREREREGKREGRGHVSQKETGNWADTLEVSLAILPSTCNILPLNGLENSLEGHSFPCAQPLEITCQAKSYTHFG